MDGTGQDLKKKILVNARGQHLSIVSGALIIAFLLPCLVWGNPCIAGPKMFDLARKNGFLANEGFQRSKHYLNGWLAYADPESGLIPKNLDWPTHNKDYKKGGRDIWNAGDAAADNYSFMVLTAALIDRPLFKSRMLDMLKAEIRLTSRLGRLPDTYAFSKNGFLTAQYNLGNLIFGSSEYVKDGLLPLSEWLGPSPWFDRLIGILDDMRNHAPVDTPWGQIVSDNAELNGEMLLLRSKFTEYTKQTTIKFLSLPGVIS